MMQMPKKAQMMIFMIHQPISRIDPSRPRLTKYFLERTIQSTIRSLNVINTSFQVSMLHKRGPPEPHGSDGETTGDICHAAQVA